MDLPVPGGPIRMHVLQISQSFGYIGFQHENSRIILEMVERITTVWGFQGAPIEPHKRVLCQARFGFEPPIG
jgi:hypothetical protein